MDLSLAIVPNERQYVQANERKRERENESRAAQCWSRVCKFVWAKKKLVVRIKIINLSERKKRQQQQQQRTAHEEKKQRANMKKKKQKQKTNKRRLRRQRRRRQQRMTTTDRAKTRQRNQISGLKHENKIKIQN